MPPRLPAVSELQTAMQILTIAPATKQHVSWCLGKVALAFEGKKLDAETTKARAEVWMEACGDIGDALWSKATLLLIRTWRRDDHYGRSPEPADLRAAVKADLDDNAKKLQRCRSMLEAHGERFVSGIRIDTKAPAAFKTEDERTTLEGDIRRWRQNSTSFLAGMLKRRAIAAERRLAELDGRDIADWARDEDQPIVPPPPKPRTDAKAGTFTNAWHAGEPVYQPQDPPPPRSDEDYGGGLEP